MKKNLLKLSVAIGFIAVQSSLSLQAQTIGTFENLTLQANSHWDGSSMPLGTKFNSGNAIFQNYYDTAYGGFWSSGWAYSDMKDSTTAGSANLYSSRPAKGYNNSANYLAGQQGAKINLNPSAIGKVVNGFYVTNSTYAATSMKDGDSFAKKFGGTSGNDPDWFRLTVRKWRGGVMTNDSVVFYLADYRFSNNAQDYIVKTWQWVDLTSLGNVDSLQFNLSSSDVGTYGMNTPAFFCIDNFTTADSPLSIQNINTNDSFISVYPNPAEDIVNIDLSALTSKNVQLEITDITGKIIYTEKPELTSLISLNMKVYPSGIYFIRVRGENIFINKKFIKK